MADPTETARRVLDPNRRSDIRNTVDALLDQREKARETWQAALDARDLNGIDVGERGFWSVTLALRDVLDEAFTAAPELARALIESQAQLRTATEEQSRAWALLTGERWTQTRAEGSLVEAAARMRDQLAAANARAETAERQIAVHEASAKEQLRLSLAVGAAMREVTQTEIGSGNHAAARARWEEAKKKFAAFQLAPLAGPLERIEAERDALRADLARVTAERDEARDRLGEVVPVLDRVIEERDAAKAAEAAAIRTMDQALDEYAKLPRVEADLATARESVRELVDGLTALLLVLPDGPTRCPACNCSWSDREIAKMRDDRAGACWCGKWAFDIDALLAKHAAPAPTTADAARLKGGE